MMVIKRHLRFARSARPRDCPKSLENFIAEMETCLNALTSTTDGYHDSQARDRYSMKLSSVKQVLS